VEFRFCFYAAVFVLILLIFITHIQFDVVCDVFFAFMHMWLVWSPFLSLRIDGPNSVLLLVTRLSCVFGFYADITFKTDCRYCSRMSVDHDHYVIYSDLCIMCICLTCLFSEEECIRTQSKREVCDGDSSSKCDWFITSWPCTDKCNSGCTYKMVVVFNM
jgi:hypothetical protein